MKKDEMNELIDSNLRFKFFSKVNAIFDRQKFKCLQ